MNKHTTPTTDTTRPEYNLKYKIAISGAADTGHCAPDALEKTEKLGALLAQKGIITVTGATIGAPYWAAKGAKMAGGIVIGFSPAASKLSHVKTYHLPVDYHDIIVYTGFEYSGRNLVLVRSADAMITVCGRMGTLNEFTIAFEDQKPIGVLTETGGTADMLEDILEKAHRGHGKVVFDNDPERLIDKLIELIKEEEKEINST